MRKTPRKGKLRKIVERLRFAETLYHRDKCLLECGHVVYSRGIYQARCRKCAVVEAENEQTK